MKKVHNTLVFNRRVDVLSRELAERIPENARVLDIGCGSGDIAKCIMALRPDVTIEGVDVYVRGETAIPIKEFDGKSIPAEDGEYDIAMLVDVLHHADDPAALLGEASRVAANGVLVKDHFEDGFLAGPTLRFMDWVGNASHGVRLPYNYLSRSEWEKVWDKHALEPKGLKKKLGLYPAPFDMLFERGLHFVSMLAPRPA